MVLRSDCLDLLRVAPRLLMAHLLLRGGGIALVLPPVGKPPLFTMP